MFGFTLSRESFSPDGYLREVKIFAQWLLIRMAALGLAM
jgi:hypothetical protein